MAALEKIAVLPMCRNAASIEQARTREEERSGTSRCDAPSVSSALSQPFRQFRWLRGDSPHSAAHNEGVDRSHIVRVFAGVGDGHSAFCRDSAVSIAWTRSGSNNSALH